MGNLKEVDKPEDDTTLVALDAAERALASAGTFEKVLEIRDKAEAIRCLKVRDGSLDLQNQAAILKLRAERRLGEMLDHMDRQGVGRPTGNLPTMGDLNIGHSEAARWHLEAQVLDSIFEAWIAAQKAKSAEITQAALLRLAKGTGGDADNPRAKPIEGWLYLSFWVPPGPDGAEIVAAALAVAKEQAGVDNEGVALTNICRDYLAGTAPEKLNQEGGNI